MGCGGCGGGTGIVGVVKGAFGLAKSEAGIGIAAASEIEARRKACEACSRWEHGRCLECKCFTWAKTRLTHERCPLGKWGAAT
jgi:hypothetical protein